MEVLTGKNWWNLIREIEIAIEKIPNLRVWFIVYDKMEPFNMKDSDSKVRFYNNSWIV